MFRRIRDERFRILLDGNGGDQLAGNGFHHLLPLIRSFRWLRLLTHIRGIAAAYKIPAWRLFLIGCVKPSIPGRIKAIYRNSHLSLRGANPSLVREEALVRTGAQDRMTQGVAIPAFKSLVHSEMYEAIFSGWGPTVLTESYDLLASFHGLELRQPFRDRRLVEFAMALPTEQLWGGGWSRVAYRNAMRGVLPEKILQRRGKAEFSPQYSIVLAGSQANEVRDIIKDSVLARLGLLDGDVLREQIEQYQNGPGTNTSVWISDLIALEIACREILGERISAPQVDGETGAEMPCNWANNEFL
jgi:asparagine synthase (glutamine-hydrolysing)